MAKIGLSRTVLCMFTRTEAEARTVLAALGVSHRLPHVGAQLLPSTLSCVFRLPGVPLVAKVAPPETDSVRLALEVTFAKGLCDRGILFARPAEAYGDQPLGQYGAYVTLWRFQEPAAGVHVNWSAAGAALQGFQVVAEQVHQQDHVPLKRHDAMRAIAKSLQGAELRANTMEPELELLATWHGRLMADLMAVEHLLGFGALHGDFSPQNLVHTAQGPMLVDTDDICTGPREWDLLGMATCAATGEISESDYQSFCAGYGADVREWPSWEPYARVYQLARTLQVLRYRRVSGYAAQEAQARLDWWQAGADLTQVATAGRRS